MKYLLDTNTCIHHMKHEQNTLTAFASKKSEGISISSIVLAELEFGVCNSDAYDRNRNKLISFLTLVETLPFDGADAIVYGNICADLRRKGTPVGQMDMLIAAHAKSKGLIIVTNNIREFERIEGLEMESWSKQ